MARASSTWAAARKNFAQGGIMSDIAPGASACAPQSFTRPLYRLALAGLLATSSALAMSSVAQARITQIKILNWAIAFGGYSSPIVGQYEFITGIATGEIDPRDQRNAIITDIELA